MHFDKPSALYPRGHAPQLLQLSFGNNSRPQYNPGHRVGLFTGPANKPCSIIFYRFEANVGAQNLPNI